MEKEKCKLNHYKIYCNNTFNKMSNQINVLKDYFNNSIKLCESLSEKMNIYQEYLDNIDYNIWHHPNKMKNNDYYEELKNEYDLFNEQISKYNDLPQNIEKIEEEFIKIKIFEFFPEDINAFDFDTNSLLSNQNNTSNKNTLKMVSYLDFANNYNKSNSNNSKIYLENKNIYCNECGKNNVEIVGEVNNNLYCNTCYNKIKYKMNGKEIDKLKKNEIDKIYFLNSIESIIKYILLKCNNILNEGEKNQNNNIIRKEINYPIIGDNQDDYVNFLLKINELNKININIHNFSLFKLDNDLIKKIENIYKQKLVLNLNFNQNSFEENESSEGEFVNEACNENSEKSEEKESEEIDKSILNNYYYFINIISKDNIKLSENIKIKLLNKLNINPHNFIASNNNKYFIDNFVRTNNFLNLSLEEIKNLYPNLEELYEYKNIVDYLIKECSIKDYVDCKGNFIIKINNKDKTKEKYYPPYEWIGIGVKVLGKYENDEWILDDSKDSKWAIAYHGVGGGLPIRQVKDKLEKKIKEGLKQGNSQTKCHSEDIRHPEKKIGTGVYLTPNINIVENYSGIISINKERYKVALMVKARIDKIRESKDVNFWILNSKYIRVYRILLKKLNKYH